ncbi:TATA box-binding protein-associated factor RNA polymerase I subunit C isoform X2 [Alosa sapidissima]|uniref:TATA box-binding protein-associated factor RNA polymerase I subunit C isoform X2 n=1 Tax=Alosa sapidissima TaxID=34773 RepID=UPI001C08EE82|nr:TATA box-binding protein-associated factor RNA polymerase I subunit C isoform X2 [Alosa sapidissima]
MNCVFTNIIMDNVNDFPCQLFSCFFNDGPPDAKRGGNVGGWRFYNHVIGREDHRSVQWQAQNEVKGERWLATQPLVLPLLPPNEAHIYSSGLHAKTEPMDFLKHMQNFYQDHSTYAFQSMSHLLLESFYPEKRHRQTYEFLRWRRTVLRDLKYTACPVSTTRMRTQCYDNVFGHDLHDIPPPLLAELLHEELVHQGEQEELQEVATGGALSCISLSDSNDPQEVCLIYPSNPGLQTLNFHKVELKSSRAESPQLQLRGQPIVFDLTGPIRQVSTGTLQEAVYVGVRSDHFCGAWLVGDSTKPRALEVIQTKEPATCLVVSPHVSKELLVASESGAVYLWTVGKGLTKVREEDSNLYFNAKSAWRWCEFSAHPRVMVYTDRTGADLTDFRTSENQSYTLFRIGKVSEAKRGERVIMSRYLSEVHAYHHLVTTQYSAYIMDERMPSVPMLKWDHFMESPPMFAHVLPGTSPRRNNQLLLGSQKTQELMMLQYSGGREEACAARGPHHKLLSPSETLPHLPVRLPHKNQTAQERLSLPAAGLTAIQSSQHLCVLQLTAAGDVFYQTLGLCSEGLAEDSSRSSERHEAEEGGDRCQPPVSSDCSDEDSEPSQRRSPGGFEVVANVSAEHLSTSDLENECGQQLTQSLGSSVQPPVMAASLPSTRLQLNKEVLREWNEWLSGLDSLPAPKSHFSHCTKHTRDMGVYVNLQSDPLKEPRWQSVQQDLRRSMSRGEILVHSSTHLPPLTITPVPGVLEPSEWTDDLSQRLSEAWQGRWRQWWEDKLGLNREQKREALRQKRRQEKAKGRRRVSLARSFTSSVSYQSDSELSGISSQNLGSDWDEDVTRRPGSSKSGALSPELTITSNLSLGKPLFQSTQSSEPLPVNTPHLSAAAQESPLVESSEFPPLLLSAEPSRPSMLGSAQKRPKRTEQDLLQSLFSSQEASQALLEESSLSMMAPSSQLSSFSSSQRPPQIRASLSQASLPKKKKTRMGF